MTPLRPSSPVRYAVVGLGHIAQAAVLPAFAHARRNSVLAALVSSDPEKRRALSERYDVPEAVDYAAYDRLLAGGSIDAVYVAVPNARHCEFALAALRAGVHVLCEKPLAVNERECELLIEASRQRGAKLMAAYRLHFDAASTHAMEIARSGELGELRLFDSLFSMQVRPDNVRLAPTAQGGGPLFDLGVYCINAARHLFGAEPIEAIATAVAGADARFEQTEEAVSAILRFPGGRVATFSCSFGAADVSTYRLVGTRGDLVAEPAYEYAQGLRLHVTVDGKRKTRSYRRRDQFAPELLHFSDCILEGREPEPSGLEGLIDVHAARSILASAQRGEPVRLLPYRKQERPSLALEVRKPPVRKPPLVHAHGASR